MVVAAGRLRTVSQVTTGPCDSKFHVAGEVGSEVKQHRFYVVSYISVLRSSLSRFYITHSQHAPQPSWLSNVILKSDVSIIVPCFMV